MEAQMNLDLFNHMAAMEAKLNEMMKLAEEKGKMTNGTQKTEAKKLKDLIVVMKAEMGNINVPKRAENEVRNMELALCELKKEKDAAALQNQSLQLEVDDLMNKLAIKEQELSKKDDEMERLKNGLFCSREDLFSKLSKECLIKIFSYTCPQDAGRLSVVGTSFKSAADSDAVWEAFMGSDHMAATILKMWPPAASIKELFLRFADVPILFDNATKSLLMDRWTGQKSYLLGTRSLYIGVRDKPVGWWQIINVSGSRFPEVIELISVTWLGIRGKFSKKYLSPNTMYETYLVYKLTPESYGIKNQPMVVSWGCGEEGELCEIQTVFLDHSFINIEMVNEPEERSDGWLEIKMGVYFNGGGEDINGFLHIEVFELHGGLQKGGLIVEGIEIRPAIDQRYSFY